MRRAVLAFTMLLAIAVPCQAQAKPNTLTPKEIADGWILLFDGETTFGWKPITREPKQPPTFGVESGVLRIGKKGNKSEVEFATHFASCEIAFDYQTDWHGRYFELKGEGDPDAVSVIIHDGLPLAGGPLRQTEKDQWLTFVSSYRVDRDKKTLSARYELSDETGNVLKKHVEAKSNITIRKPVAIWWIAKNTGVKLRNIKLRPLDTKSIFNGKDLAGWKEFPGKKSKFAVNDKGELNVKDGPGDLQTVGKYKDFVLQLECISNGKHLNSGIFFRCRDNEYQNGYEAQIRNQFTAEATQKYLIEEYDPKTNMLAAKKEITSTAFDYGTGAIYRRVPARKAMSKDGEWFGMTIVAQGNHLATWVNGVQVTDWHDHRPKSDNARTGCKLEAGHISIQGHDPTTDLSFRNFRIAELPAGK